MGTVQSKLDEATWIQRCHCVVESILSTLSLHAQRYKVGGSTLYPKRLMQICREQYHYVVNGRDSIISPY